MKRIITLLVLLTIGRNLCAMNNNQKDVQQDQKTLQEQECAYLS